MENIGNANLAVRMTPEDFLFKISHGIDAVDIKDLLHINLVEQIF